MDQDKDLQTFTRLLARVRSVVGRRSPGVDDESIAMDIWLEEFLRSKKSAQGAGEENKGVQGVPQDSQDTLSSLPYVAIRNRCYDELRRKRRRDRADTGYAKSRNRRSGDHDQNLDSRSLVAALLDNGLCTDNERRFIFRHYYEGRSLEAIAESGEFGPRSVCVGLRNTILDKLAAAYRRLTSRDKSSKPL